MHWKALRDAIVCSSYIRRYIKCAIFVLHTIDYITLISWEQYNILTKNWRHNICSHDATCAEHGPSLTHFAARIGCRSWRPAWKKSARGGKHATMLVVLWCCWVAVALDFATVLHADFLTLHWRSFHPVLRHAMSTREFHDHFVFKALNYQHLHQIGDLPPDIGNTQTHCMNKQRWTLDIIPIQPIQILYIESVPRLLYMIGCETAHYSFVWEHWTHLKKCRIYGPRYREDRRFQRGTIDRFSLPSNHFSTDMINIQAEDCYLKTRAHRSFHLLDSRL